MNYPNRKAAWSAAPYIKKSPSLLSLDRLRTTNLSRTLQRTLDRVNVLGDDERYGHSGCVNALSWAYNGELLLSGGDDKTVRIWRMNTADSEQEYPFVCRFVINTGHHQNIFNAQMLPHSSKIATVAGDSQVRVFDVSSISSTASDGVETQYSAHQANVRIFRCHGQRVKRIVTEDSPDLFLTVGEDGTVRQHDLRTHHRCRNGECSAPLMKVSHELSTLSLSSLTPYQFVVAGDSPYGYLFDRRQYGPLLEEQWGMVPRVGEQLTTCVRRFGRPPKAGGESNQRRDHITGARVSEANGHEVLLSYNGDGVYLFSTLDSPDDQDSLESTSSSIIPPNSNASVPGEGCAAGKVNSSREIEDGACTDQVHENNAASSTRENDDNNTDESGSDDEDEDEEAALLELDDITDIDESRCEPGVPIIMPRRRYVGARNVATIKDVNFLGPDDEWVTSGSDDGNFFMWDKKSGALHGIYEGDSTVVNVIEGHPYLPLIAVSGIDTTVKLFAPTSGPSSFSRISNVQQITEENTRRSRTRIVRYNFAALLAEMGAAGEAEGAGVPVCTSQ